MAHSKKSSELGWFYHTVNKTRSGEAVPVPPASQIPGLSSLQAEPSQLPPARGWFRDTDSDYVRLAKNGGRRDLLLFRDPKPRSHQPKNYPRVDWFYLEDIAAEEAEKSPGHETTGPYQFMLPEYMVHQAYQGDVEDTHYVPKRATFHFDNKSAFQREADGITEKKRKLPELVNKPGRNYKPPQVEKPSSHKYQSILSRDTEEEKPMMSKILSFGYAQECQGKKQHRQQEAKNKSVKTQDKLETEYRSEMVSHCPKQTSPQNRIVDYRKHESRHSKPEQTKSEPFKLSRFKNIPCKTETHRMPVQT